MKQFSGVLAVLCFLSFAGACERQSYQTTRAYTHHGEHAQGDASPHKASARETKTSEHK